MNTQALLWAQLALSGLLMWSCFCRLVRTNAETVREIRWAILFEGVAAGLLLGAPFLPQMLPETVVWPPGTTPTWCWLLLLCAACMVQIVTAKYWIPEAPRAFQRRPVPPTGSGAVFAVLLILVGLGSFQAKATAQPSQPPSIAVVDHGDVVRCLSPDGCAFMSISTLQAVDRHLQAGTACLDAAAKRRAL